MDASSLAGIVSSANCGICIKCWIQPRASKTIIRGIHGDSLKISLAAPPVDGKANEELCEFFSDLLSVSKSSVKIVSGLSSRKKTVLVTGVTTEQFFKAVS